MTDGLRIKEILVEEALRGKNMPWVPLTCKECLRKTPHLFVAPTWKQELGSWGWVLLFL